MAETENTAPTLDRVETVRQELRDGRRTSQTAKSDVKDAGNNATQHGSQLKVLPGKSSGAGQADRNKHSVPGSVEEKSVRERSADRRLSENNSRANDPVSSTTTANTRTVGALTADEPIPSRLPELPGTAEKRGPGRPRKEPDEESAFAKFKAPFKEGKVLSKKEVEELREPFMGALRDDFKYLDEALWWWSHDGSEPQIWSDLDNEEIEVIARTMLRRGERSPAAALAVRNIVDGSDYINTAVIMVPRLIKTAQQVNKRPRKEKGKRREDTH